jgi:hypothetical protein
VQWFVRGRDGAVKKGVEFGERGALTGVCSMPPQEWALYSARQLTTGRC